MFTRLVIAALGASLAQVAFAQQKDPPNVAMCEGCHGIAGYKTAFPSVYHVPKIGGQQPAYIVNALKAYKAGARSHPSMRGIAGSLSEEEMKAYAGYYGGNGKPAPVETEGNASAGKAKAAQVCAACHGPAGNKPSTPDQPILAGQHYDYLVRALTDYKIGRRTNPIMKAFASQLSEQDIEDVAAWFSSRESRLHIER